MLTEAISAVGAFLVDICVDADVFVSFCLETRFLLSSVYSLHQLEEHGYDIYGRRYMFVPIFNKSIEGLLGIAVSVRLV